MSVPSSKAPWESRQRPSGKRLLRQVVSWGLVLGVVGLIGYGLRPRPVEVEVAEVTKGSLTVYVTEEAKTRVRNRYIVSVPVAGQMRRVTLRAGDVVKADETVITVVEPAVSALLDPRSKAQAEAQVQVTEAAKMQAAQALSLAKTSEKFALSNWERVRSLNEKGSISVTDRDNAEREASMRQQEVRGAEFALKVSEFEVEQAKSALLQAVTPGTEVIEVKSPVNGQVLRVLQESATVVTPGTQLVEVGDAADIEIEAEILSRDAIAIKPKAPVSVEQWGGTEALHAVVNRVEPAAFTKVSALGVEEQRVIVRSDLVNPPEAAKALGDRYRVEVRIAVWHGDSVTLVPSGALFREGSEWKTFVMKGGHAVATQVSVGHTDGRVTELTSQLPVGTQVLVHPPDAVKDGTEVVKRKIDG